jgi:hypothetical protein
MRKIYFTLMLTIVSLANYAQTATNQIGSTGNVGIGTTSPNGKLQIVGPLDGSIPNLEIGDPSPGNINVPVGASTGGYNIDFHTWRDVVSNQIGARIRGERINSYEPNNALVQSMDMVFYTSYGGDQTQLTEKLRIKSSGNVLIGQSTQTNPGYLLDVAGPVRANSITVNTSGADFVFEPTYKLLSLPTLKEYIVKNHHLPEIASAKEMQVDGLNVGENQVKLLQKVEELTLYLIEKDKKINEQQKQIDTQNERITKLEAAVMKMMESKSVAQE